MDVQSSFFFSSHLHDPSQHLPVKVTCYKESATCGSCAWENKVWSEQLLNHLSTISHYQSTNNPQTGVWVSEVTQTFERSEIQVQKGSIGCWPADCVHYLEPGLGWLQELGYDRLGQQLGPCTGCGTRLFSLHCQPWYCGKIMVLLRDHLQDFSFQGIIIGIKSRSHKTGAGAPQGSMLGPDTEHHL